MSAYSSKDSPGLVLLNKTTTLGSIPAKAFTAFNCGSNAGNGGATVKLGPSKSIRMRNEFKV